MWRVKVFYGWKMATAAAGLQFLYSALLLQAYGAYVAVVSIELGWSKTVLSGGAAILSLEGALIGPVLGWMVDRMGPRIVVRSGVVLFSLGFLALSHIETLGGFYATMVLIAVGASLCSYFPLSVALVHFFRRHRTRALSLMTFGIAAGGIVLPLVGWAMQQYGWRDVALASAVAILILGWPLASMIRGDPAEVGETIDGMPLPESTDPSGEAAVQEPELTAAQALRTKAFWLLGVAHGLALLVVMAVSVHAISHMTEGLGYSLPQASFFITLMTLGQGAGILLGAVIGDRWDKRRIAAGCMLGHMTGLLMLTFAMHPSMIIAFGVLHGVAWGVRGPLMQALRADYFGLRSIGMILGLSGVLVAVGQMAGPLVAGMTADWTGDYRAGFILLALLSGLGSAMFLLARKPALPGG